MYSTDMGSTTYESTTVVPSAAAPEASAPATEALRAPLDALAFAEQDEETAAATVDLAAELSSLTISSDSSLTIEESSRFISS